MLFRNVALVLLLNNAAATMPVPVAIPYAGIPMDISEEAGVDGNTLVGGDYVNRLTPLPSNIVINEGDVRTKAACGRCR